MPHITIEKPKNCQVLIKSWQNWTKQEIEHYLLRTTDLFV